MKLTFENFCQCARDDIDLVAQCHKHKSTPETSVAPGLTDWNDGTRGKYTPHMDIDVNDCDVLEEALDPYCAWSNAGNWVSKVCRLSALIYDI